MLYNILSIRNKTLAIKVHDASKCVGILSYDNK